MDFTENLRSIELSIKEFIIYIAIVLWVVWLLLIKWQRQHLFCTKRTNVCNWKSQHDSPPTIMKKKQNAVYYHCHIFAFACELNIQSEAARTTHRLQLRKHQGNKFNFNPHWKLHSAIKCTLGSKFTTWIFKSQYFGCWLHLTLILLNFNLNVIVNNTVSISRAQCSKKGFSERFRNWIWISESAKNCDNLRQSPLRPFSVLRFLPLFCSTGAGHLLQLRRHLLVCLSSGRGIFAKETVKKLYVICPFTRMNGGQ